MSETKTPTHFVVDRSRWRTGLDYSTRRTGIGTTRLRNSQGFSCCLGFVCQQLGVEVSNCTSPYQVAVKTRQDISYLTGELSDTPLAERCIAINDDGNTTPEHKEELLKKEFADAGLTIEFEGEYTRPGGGEA